MDLYLIQGWPTPFFAAEFTAATAAVKPENALKPAERLAKGLADRVGLRNVSASVAAATQRYEKRLEAFSTNKNKKRSTPRMPTLQTKAPTPVLPSRFSHTALASAAALAGFAPMSSADYIEMKCVCW